MVGRNCSFGYTPRPWVVSHWEKNLAFTVAIGRTVSQVEFFAGVNTSLLNAEARKNVPHEESPSRFIYSARSISSQGWEP